MANDGGELGKRSEGGSERMPTDRKADIKLPRSVVGCMAGGEKRLSSSHNKWPRYIAADADDGDGCGDW